MTVAPVVGKIVDARRWVRACGCHDPYVFCPTYMHPHGPIATHITCLPHLCLEASSIYTRLSYLVQ